MVLTINEIIKNCEKFVISKNYESYDLFDAMTNNFINKITKDKKLLRRIVIQVVSKSPFDLHWLGMKKMLHTKTISDMLFYYSINGENNITEINRFFELLIKRRIGKSYGWGLNFPYTSRFIDTGADIPNLYNTSNAGISICYSFLYLNNKNQIVAKEAIKEIVNVMEKDLGYVDEKNKGWYRYYPGQIYPVYNVNAFAIYFLAFIKKLEFYDSDFLDKRINAISNLLVEEQEDDGSWFYSRSAKGKWIDGFHTGFIIESLAFVYKESYEMQLKETLQKGWIFYIEKMFTKEGYPKYFLESGKYPIESQNYAQAIQSLSNIGIWLNWEEKKLLDKIIKITIDNLYDNKGFFIHKKTKYFTNKKPFIRWSISPMMVALSFALKYNEHESQK